MRPAKQSSSSSIITHQQAQTHTHTHKHLPQTQVELTRSDRDDRVLELTLKHTKNRNSLTGMMMATLHDLSLELTKPTGGQYQDCCALILRGEGTSFCAGADFHLASSILTPEEGVMMAEIMTSTLTRLRYVWQRREREKRNRHTHIHTYMETHTLLIINTYINIQAHPSHLSSRPGGPCHGWWGRARHHHRFSCYVPHTVQDPICANPHGCQLRLGGYFAPSQGKRTPI